jgi:hypothetical protein
MDLLQVGRDVTRGSGTIIIRDPSCPSEATRPMKMVACVHALTSPAQSQRKTGRQAP